MIKKIVVLFFLSMPLIAQDEINLDPSEIPFPAENSNNSELKTESSPGNTPVAPEPIEKPVNIQVPVEELTRKDVLPEKKTTTEQVPVTQKSMNQTPDNLQVHQQIKNEQDTAPSTEREEKYHQIYEKYNSAETPPENWEKIIGKRKAEIYVVQKGDTLWDISKTLFGDPFFWPKLWAVNKEIIFNPHEIDPKMNIKFYPGAMGIVPSLALTDKKDPTVAEDVNQSISIEKKKSDVTPTPLNTLGAKDRKLALPANKIPNSFPDYVITEEDKLGSITVEKRRNLKIRNEVPLEFVVRENPLQTFEEIHETEFGTNSASDFQNVYVKIKDSNSKSYTVLKTAKEINFDKNENKPPIYLYEVEGEVEVLNRVNSQENIFKAVVTKSRNFVSKGSLLIPGKMPTVDSQNFSSSSSMSSAQILGNLQDNKLITKNSFVVINQGNSSGYQKGSLLPIYPNMLARKRATIVLENQSIIGQVIIAETTDRFSVGYVKNIYEQVYPNDFIGMVGDQGSGSVPQVSQLTPETSTNSESESGEKAKGSDSNGNLEESVEQPSEQLIDPSEEPSEEPSL